MGLACTVSVALVGLEGRIVEVAADIGGGLPRTVLVGLPDAALYEARDRCKAAVSNSGQQWPSSLLTIALSPATLPKAGSHYDLAIVAAVLAAAGAFPADRLDGTVLLGELGLDGRLRPVRGLLPAVLAAAQAGFRRVVVPVRQASEAELVHGVEVVGLASLTQLVAWCNLDPLPAVEPVESTEGLALPNRAVPDLADVSGQHEARWSLEVAAAGGHHLFLHGPPGVGKTMLAERLPGLLPDLCLSDALEVSGLHSLVGASLADGLITRPPYADPHHSATVASIVGGGPRAGRPGAISLAHRGVLFLDEAPEFAPRVLEALRTPLESGRVSIARSQLHVSYPARFQLVLAANPCPCGYASTPGADCRCAPMAVRRYAEKLSGPIRDRIDIHQSFRQTRSAYLTARNGQGESTAVVAGRVAAARERQLARLAETPWRTNSEVSGAHLRLRLPRPAGVELIEDALHRGQLSPRGMDKVLRIAWTLADLAGHDRPTAQDTAAALAMRRGEPGLSVMREVS